MASQQASPTPAPQVETQSVTEERSAPADNRGAAASYDTFYTKLQPYGDWVETSDYGYVFQPRQAQHSQTWRPYTNGHWVYTDVGWAWVSDEPFGWAAYHYGRWTRLRNVGWVWVPGDEWAPAWVSWRKSDSYVGWAPLPPEARFDRRTGIHNWADNYYDIGPDNYSFVETRSFGSPRVEAAVVPAQQNLTIVNQTTNVTNITYNNTTVINQGPSYEEIRTRTAEPVQRLRLEREVNVSVNVGESRPVIRGDVLTVPAPVIGRAQAVERPRAVRERVTNVVVERGWEGIADGRAVEQARTKMRSEATPPPNAPPKTFVRPLQAGSPRPATVTTPSMTIAPPQAGSSPAPAATESTNTPTATPFRRMTPQPSPMSTSATPTPHAASTAVAATATPSPTITPRPPVRPRLSSSPSVAATSTPLGPTMTPLPSARAHLSASPTVAASPAAPATTPTPSHRRPVPVPTQESTRPPLSDIRPSPRRTPPGAPRAVVSPSPGASTSPTAAAATSRAPRATATPAEGARQFESRPPTIAPHRPPAAQPSSTPAPSLTPETTPESSASPPVARSAPAMTRREERRDLRQEEKAERKAERRKPGEPNESVSPSPSATAP
jgi:hypothetical protein